MRLGCISQALRRITRAQLVLCLVPFFLGALNLILKATLENAAPPEKIIEWIFALLMHGYVILSYFAWRETDFAATFSVRSR